MSIKGRAHNETDMHNGTDIRSIYNIYSGNSSLITESKEQPGEIPELGIRVVRNGHGDNDGDRYYETWEIYPMDNTSGSGAPLDWDYAGGTETVEDVVARVKRNFEMRGTPTL